MEHTVELESARSTQRERLLANSWATTTLICAVWVLADHLGLLGYRLLSRFSLQAGDSAEPYTIDVVRKFLGVNRERILPWVSPITAVVGIALCVWVSNKLRRSDWRTELRRMGLVRPRWQELVVIAFILPAIGVMAWRYGLGLDLQRGLGPIHMLESIARPMLQFGFFFLALHELAGHSLRRAGVIVVAVWTALWVSRVALSPGASWSSDQLTWAILGILWISVSAWIYVRWENRVWALALQAISVNIFWTVTPDWQNRAWVGRSLTFDTICLVSTMLFVVLWTLISTKPLRAR